jgi:hypothetical protein
MPAGLGSMLDAAINRLEKEPDFKPASKSSASFEDNGEDIVDDDKLLIHCPMTAKEAFNWVLSFIITSWFNYPSQHPVMNICGACENRKGCELEVEECPDYLLGVEKVGNSFELCIKEWSKAAITLLLGTTTAWNKVILGSKNCGDNIIFAKEK